MDIWQQFSDFEPFLCLLDIQAEVLGPDDVVLRLLPRQEIANHLGGLHGGAQFTLNQAAPGGGLFSLGMQLDQAGCTHEGRDNKLSKNCLLGELTAHARIMHEERENLQTTWGPKAALVLGPG